MNKIIDIRTYQPKADDRFMLDANIWLYLYCPLGNYNQTAIQDYDGFLKRAISVKAAIWVSSLILSEVINRWLRLDSAIFKKLHKKRNMDFKRDYRRTANCRGVSQNIADVIEGKMFQIAGRIDDNFSGIDASAILKNMAGSDFNDLYYSKLASMNDLAVVTHDVDFGNIPLPVTILTGNQKMLRW
jgi:predicted nucleic acid-binding protein